MKHSLVILLAFLGNFCFSQIDFDNPPWEIGCADTADTQYDMNRCAAKELAIADSILSAYYVELIAEADSLYQKEARNVVPNATSREREYVDQLLQKKNALIQSRIDFNTFNKTMMDANACTFDDGSMCPMVHARFHLILIVNQLKMLTYMTNWEFMYPE